MLKSFDKLVFRSKTDTSRSSPRQTQLFVVSTGSWLWTLVCYFITTKPHFTLIYTGVRAVSSTWGTPPICMGLILLSLGHRYRSLSTCTWGTNGFSRRSLFVGQTRRLHSVKTVDFDSVIPTFWGGWSMDFPCRMSLKTKTWTFDGLVLSRQKLINPYLLKLGN